MFRTLKGKIAFVYLGLVALIALVGTVSVISLFNLSNAVDTLMVDNFKSIQAVNNMVDALEREDSAILFYINVDKQEGLNSFTDSDKAFSKWFGIEYNNITQPGEMDYVDQINTYYKRYTDLFSELQQVNNRVGTKNAMELYNNQMTKQSNMIKEFLRNVSLLNENAMLKSKSDATKNAFHSSYFLLFLSITAVVVGFILSYYFVNRFLKPMHSLIQTIKRVKEGDLNQLAPIISKDEVGELALEFNNMTRRLLEYDKSTIGKLMIEKNKSLAIVKSIYDPLIVMDTDFKIILLNSACEKFFHVDEEKAINKHFLEVIQHGELFECITSVLQPNYESKEKTLVLKSDGYDFYFNVLVTKVKDAELRITGFVVTFHNVTELKQLEMVKTDFISTISHEFKTPLTSILMGTSLMENENLGTLTRKQKNILYTISEDGERLSTLVNNLLELSRIESGKSVFNLIPYSIVQIIQNCMNAIQKQVTNKDVKIYFESVDDLPLVIVDVEKISWVINNLLTNALKYTGKGDLIHIRADERDRELWISVRDSGIGIPEEYQEKIFEKFVQVKGHDLEVRGTGLGLAIVKEIVEVHGGKIWCESKPDAGSMFTFTLPVISKEDV